MRWFLSGSQLIVFAALLGTIPAHAKECTATFTSNAAAVEDPSVIAKKGTTRSSATQYRVDKRTSDARVCFKGGYCYPASRIRLSCAVDWGSGIHYDTETIYYFK